MEPLTQQLQKTNIKAAVFVPKKPAGTRGDQQLVKTNLAKVDLKPNTPYFKYDVVVVGKIKKADGSLMEKEITKPSRDDFTQQQRKTACVAVFKEALQKSGRLFEAATTFYDRAKVLFSLKKLALDGEKTIAFSLAIQDFDIKDWEFRIKPCGDSFQVTTNDLSKVVNANTALQDKTLFEALNLILSREALLESDEFVTYGAGTHYLIDPAKYSFKPNELPRLPDGKKMMVAVSKKVSVLEGDTKKPTAYVTTEIKKTSIHNAQPLLEKLKEYAFMQGQVTPDAIRRNLKALRQMLKNKAAFAITSIADQSARTTSFRKKDGSSVNIAEYFSREKKITLKYPDLNLIVGFVGGKEVCYPPEVLMVAEHQRVVNSQSTPEETQIAIKASATLPADRLRQTENMKKAMKLTSTSKSLVDSGIKVSDELATVPGRVLPAPTLLYGSSATVKPQNNKMHFIAPATVKNWWLVGNIARNDRNMTEGALRTFGEKVVSFCRGRGMPISELVIRHIEPTPRDLEALFEEAKREQIRYLLIVSTDSVKFHDNIKLLEVQTQILTQEVKGSNAFKVAQGQLPQTLENIVNKINEKNGGLGYRVSMANVPKGANWLDEKARLIIGLEMSHPAPLTAAEKARGLAYRSPSILGYASNSGKHPQQFLGDYLYVEPRVTDSMGEQLAVILPRIITECRTNRNATPTHLVLFFHGVSEGQYAEIATTYTDFIRNGLDTLSKQYKPTISLIAVSKEHNERFYNQKISGERAAEQNIRPGTIVDQVVVNPAINEFYLMAHSAFQGTAKSPKYTVVSDTSNNNIDFFEGICHGLCYLHEIVNATVSLSAPLIVADRCAKRGAKNFNASQSQKVEGGPLNFQTLNQELTNVGQNANDGLDKVRYNA